MEDLDHEVAKALDEFSKIHAKKKPTKERFKPNKMTNEVTYWAVFYPEGNIWTYTISETEAGAWHESTDLLGRDEYLEQAKKIGYTVRKVKIIPVE